MPSLGPRICYKGSYGRTEGFRCSADELDIIVLATSSLTAVFKGACEVQAAIGAQRAIAFDLSAACSGFVYGFHTISAFFQQVSIKTGLIIGAYVKQS